MEAKSWEKLNAKSNFKREKLNQIYKTGDGKSGAKINGWGIKSDVKLKLPNIIFFI